MKSDDEIWDELIDTRFSLLALSSSRGRHQLQYLDMVTGWGEDVVLRLREGRVAGQTPGGSPEGDDREDRRPWNLALYSPARAGMRLHA